MATVKIYTTPACTYCIKAKDYFKAKNIPFEEVNVAEDMVAQQEMIARTGQLSVPVIEVNGKMLDPGWNPQKFEAAYS
ncbi:MAG: NrdH-redoxin [Candidatus Harrisonbacteria bacterium CG10_big_fil_rev_8_21_14_0_10_45_28]|uniref:NrdH-redoxin n=1 Tax=Candidatus Harrisonbacteria bacterium CG10_big_fil_rev_8_21_14_0_10_45_28 TaxID=1974586 RepID=A0A2H0UNF6_9BACT|nr:MAG: NrdH-redoxin [Candidatus Harrisonbacteria bacterium CG10_big_fil_rev_8_21_14_0_10_45_28]